MRYARLNWNDATPESPTPESMDFGDVYFSRGEGAAESRYVFLTGNGLPERWTTAPFTLAETGFGTGLNLLTLWNLWQETPEESRPAHLHYLSFEQFPLHPEDFARALAVHAPGSPLAAELLAAYPPAIPGIHHRRLIDGRLTLTLIYGDVNDWLPRLDAPHLPRPIDAWFLDGFAPAKNPDMWQPTLFTQMARLSAPDATFSTFTAAALAREGLKAAGFEVRKRPGFGRKRHSLHGYLSELPLSPSPLPLSPSPLLPSSSPLPLSSSPRRRGPTIFLSSTASPPSSAIPAQAGTHVATREETVRLPPTPILILGAGIAGAAAARHLAESGHAVTLWEAMPHPAAGASANPAALCAPLLEAGDSPRRRFYSAALSYALDFWPRILPGWQPCGWLKLATDAEEADWQRKTLRQMDWADDWLHALTPEEASRRAGLPLTHGGLFSPLGGHVPLPRAVDSLLQHPDITCHYGKQAETLEPAAEGWLATPRTGKAQRFRTVILATGDGANLLPLDIRPSAGQLTFLPPTPGSFPLRCIVNYGGHVTPYIPGLGHVAGATYRRGSEDTALTPDDDRHNLTRWQAVTPAPLPDAASSAWAGIRRAAPNHLPVIGELRPGLYASLAHGSRGSLSAPLAGFLLAEALR